MISRLRLKIIIVITIILTLAVFGIMISINMVEKASNRTQIEARIQRIASLDGFLPTDYQNYNPLDDGQSGFSDCFSIQIDYLYQIRKIVLTRDITVDQNDMIEYANQALASGSSFGEMGHYAFYIQPKYYGSVIVFMDIHSYQQAQKNLLFTTSLIGLLTIILFFFLTVALAFWLVKPVKISFENQKRFVSNASHELKTPLAVISANVDVLENETGENKWLQYIRTETVRMNELVSELLCLARLDDKSGHPLMISEFNLSDVFLQTTLPFESKVFEMGKTLDVDAQPDLMYRGDESMIKHIITILLDNAVKYSDKNGTISAALYLHNNKKIIEVYNTGEGVPKDKLQKIFERFYRQDEARNSKNGGYGLGLAIAKTGVEAMGGKITATGEYGKWIKFTVVL